MHREWSRGSAAPGSVKPIYGAQYPPLHTQYSPQNKNTKNDETLTGSKNEINFKRYQNSTSDVWETDLSNDIKNTPNLSQIDVLSNSMSITLNRNDILMPNCHPQRIRNAKTQAMQRLATQKDPLPGTNNVATTTGPLYPRLPSISSTNENASLKNIDQIRFNRLCQMFGVKMNGEIDPSIKPAENIDIEQLQKDCWMGIPHKLRPHAWRILSRYVPTRLDRREMTLKKQREEYWHYVEQYFYTRFDEQHQVTFRQIHIDIPRMCPLIPLFQQKQVQEIFERILYIWAIRHPASGYVQGINDLVTPFFVVFLSEFIPDDVEVSTFEISKLTKQQIEIIEADSFWCVTYLLETIQDNYTSDQPGIQRKILDLKDLLIKVDNNLHCHLENNQVQYLQFSFRWMNNLLMREIPLRATIRLWDTYLSERNGFSHFHTYVCAAFLRLWSKDLQREKDFQGIMLLLQNLPTSCWADQQIRELTADAYSLMSVFHGAKKHLTSSSSSTSK